VSPADEKKRGAKYPYGAQAREAASILGTTGRTLSLIVPMKGGKGYEHNIYNGKRQKNGSAMCRVSGMYAGKEETARDCILVCQIHREGSVSLLRGL
jgi:hypothetical protein